MTNTEKPCKDPCPVCGRRCQLIEGHSKFHMHTLDIGDVCEDGLVEWVAWHVWSRREE